MKAGLDIGSTTIKGVVLDDDGQIIWSSYERHYSHILEKTEEMLRQISKAAGDQPLILGFSGSAGMGIAEHAGVPFVQEVYAERVSAVKEVVFDGNAQESQQIVFSGLGAGARYYLAPTNEFGEALQSDTFEVYDENKNSENLRPDAYCRRVRKNTGKKCRDQLRLYGYNGPCRR